MTLHITKPSSQEKKKRLSHDPSSRLESLTDFRGQLMRSLPIMAKVEKVKLRIEEIEKSHFRI